MAEGQAGWRGVTLGGQAVACRAALDGDLLDYALVHEFADHSHEVADWQDGTGSQRGHRKFVQVEFPVFAEGAKHRFANVRTAYWSGPAVAHHGNGRTQDAAA